MYQALSSRIALAFFALVAHSQAALAISRDELVVWGGGNSATADTTVTFKDNFLARAENFGFAVVAVVAVGVFVFIGFKLVSARGNEEEFKKAWLSLVYAVIGLALIPASYAIVRIISGFTIG